MFALICYRQAGKVKRRSFKIFKRINSQNLYSYKHTELTIWREPTFQTFAEFSNDKRSTCRSADGLLEKKQFDILISSEGWCGKMTRDWGGRGQSSPFQHPLPPTIVLLRKITCEKEWTLIKPQPGDKRLCLRWKQIKCRRTKCSV